MRWRALWLLTGLWRRLMFRTTVIAITGSVGKSTAKECLAAILSADARTHKTRHNNNDRSGVPRTLRAMRPWHRFAVVEVGARGLGSIRPLARLVRPDIAIILCVAGTHTREFGTLENTAATKAELLDSLSRKGLAILNADDPHVRPMADRCRAGTVFFGRSAECDYRAESVESRWPGRFQFRLHAGETTTDVTTRLVGTHWLNSTLAAIAAAHACGVPVAEASRRIGEVPPFTARMQPVALPNGIVFVRDEGAGSGHTVDALFEVIQASSAPRRGLVFGDVTDTKRNPKQRLRAIGRRAAQHCDFAVFVGQHGHHPRKAAVAAGMDPANVRDFVNVQRAAEGIKDMLRPGDVVFLKGRTTDHLTRIVFAQFGEIGCWKSDCKIRRLCDICAQLKPDFDLKAARVDPADASD